MTVFVTCLPCMSLRVTRLEDDKPQSLAIRGQEVMAQSNHQI